MTSHWHILGAGAIGCLFATALHRAGSALTLITREPPADAEPEASAAILYEQADRRMTVPVALSTRHQSARIDHLLVTTKAHQAAAAVAGIAHRLTADSTILLMMNGMGLREELQRAHPEFNFFCGTTTEGAYSIGPLQIRHAGTGVTHIGQQGVTQAAPWFKDWSAGLASCEWDGDIARAQWRKLLINCAINPLTAVHRCRNGDLASRAPLAAETAALCDELARISAAAGYPEIAAELQATVAQVISGTADNRSSMLQDITAGRSTEIDYITGHLVTVANQLGVEAPLNQALLQRVRAAPAIPAAQTRRL